MYSKLEACQHATREDVLNKLYKHHFCNMVRPVGFGKTHILVNIAEGWGNPVVYVYHRDIIKKSIMKSYISNYKGDIRFISYQKLSRILEREGTFTRSSTFRNFYKGLVIWDESHSVGAAKWSQTFHKILEEFPGVYMLGGTATPVRTDGQDVTDMFGGISCFPYTLDDAIADGIYKWKPLIVEGTYDSKKLVQDMYNKERDSKLYKDENERSEYLKELKAKLISVESVMNGASMVKRNISKVYGDGTPEYLKFICFFSNYKLMYARYKTVVKWFNEAYPELETNVVIIANGTEEHKDLSRMIDLVRRPGVVDLIVCVDKLTYGYHDNDVSGVFLLRATESELILSQQFGRALSVTAKTQAIIFDLLGVIEIVENSNYSSIKVKNSVLDDDRRDKSSRKDNLLSRESVELISEYKSIEDVSLIFDRRRLQRKDGVLSVLLRGVMPPWVACKELYLTDSERLIDLLRVEGKLEDFQKVEGKWGDWRGKVYG